MGFYKKILLLGKDGQVGWELQRALAPLGELTALNRSECDLRDLSKLSVLIELERPDLIVNAAGYTDVDGAEADQRTAFEINANLPKFLATVSNVRNIPLVHFSSDYVFDGEKGTPYQETDKLNPLSIYGKSKAIGEDNVRAIANKYLIIRTSWVYGRHGDNFPKKILRLAQVKSSLDVVSDQIGVPTSAKFLVDTVVKLVEMSAQIETNSIWGVYQIVPDQEASWFDFSRLVVETALNENLQLSLNIGDVRPVSTESFPLRARRPGYSVMSNKKIKETLNCKFESWKNLAQQELIEICKEIKKNGKK